MNRRSPQDLEERISTRDKRFLGLIESWLNAHGEIFVLFRYSHAAGNKDFEFFSSFTMFAERLLRLPPLTGVSVFRQRQLPIRGKITESFIAACLKDIPNGTEFLVLEVAPEKPDPHHIAGESHAELRKALEELRDHFVALWFQECTSATWPIPACPLRPG